ncbi:hypothetical protein L1N85_25230 [Paenibacillus alkaliterrae]|nr:hypothetical protein [Paenibacillus alkaliterrae]MCF2941642.1 hypothetical protein [Paenibacillus alkaliterrae]
MPVFLYQIALLIIALRSVYVMVQLDLKRKDWINTAYHAAIAFICIYILL